MAMRSPGYRQGVAQAPNDLKLRQKERILSTLNKLNDRDTQRSAAEELQLIVTHLDYETMPQLMISLCSTGSEQKVYARKECARALGVVASQICPSQAVALQPPYLGKMLTHLKRGLADVDSSVREAAAEALSVVARGLADAGYAPPSGVGPIVKIISDCMGDGKKELQASACMALGLSAPYILPPEPAFLKELIKKVSASAFLAPHALLAAMGSWDASTGQPAGLIKAFPSLFVPLLPTLIGQPCLTSVGSNGSGVLGGLASKDWFMRRSGCDLIRTAALVLGPVLEPEGVWDATDARSLTSRCLRALDQHCKFDKVKEVRENAREAMLLLDILQDYGRQGGAAAGWPAFAEEQMKERAMKPVVSASASASAYPFVPPPLRSPSPQRMSQDRSPALRPASAAPRLARASATPPRPTSASRMSPARASAARASAARASPVRISLQKQGSVNDRFQLAHTDQDMIADARGRSCIDEEDEQPASPGAEGARPAGPESPSSYGRGLGMDLTFSEPRAPDRKVELTAEELAARAGEVVTMPMEQWRSMQQQLQEMEQRQRELMVALGSVTEHSNKTITSLQERVRSLETQGSRPSSPLRASPTTSSPLPAPPERATTLTPPPERVRPLEKQPSRVLPVAREPPVSSLLPQASWSAQKEAADLTPPCSRPKSAAPRPKVAAPESPRASINLVRPISPTPGRKAAAQDLPPAGVDAAYVAALAALDSRDGDMQLARLMQRTGCVWSNLTPGTALALLQAFTSRVQDGIMLPKITPWLWRLADEEHVRLLQLPAAPRMQVLQALAHAAATMAKQDQAASEKVLLLAQTLRSHWASSDQDAAGSGSSAAAGAATPAAAAVRRNVSGDRLLGEGQSPAAVEQLRHQGLEPKLGMLRNQLDAMQNDFLNSPHSAAGSALDK